MPEATCIINGKFSKAVGSSSVRWVLPERPHGMKYRLFCGDATKCLVRYDNEARKGDHRHYRDREERYVFTTLEALLEDFQADVVRLTQEQAMKAIIEIAGNGDMHRRAMATARAHANGRTQAADYRLGFESAAQVFAELTAERLRTLETLRRGDAQSISALAKALGRNYSNVHSDVQRLIALGLVERGERGVSAPFDELKIHVPLGARAA